LSNRQTKQIAFVGINILSENDSFTQRGQTVRRLFRAILSTRQLMVLLSVVIGRIKLVTFIGED